MDKANDFEIHYYLSDQSHSIDAFIKNKCEAEFLAVAKEICQALEVPIAWEARALEEGGIREFWTAIGNNNVQIALVLTALQLIWSTVPQTDQDLIELQKSDLRLSIEERKIKIESLKKELEKDKPSKNIIRDSVNLIINQKITVRRSNFYRTILACKKVAKIGFGQANQREKEKTVRRNQFSSFIVTNNKLPPVPVNDARIEIVSPILNGANSQWKGIYEGKLIRFIMNDSHFRNAVLSRQISFSNGSEILCAMNIFKEINEAGDIVISNYSVDTVLDNTQGGSTVETIQGKIFRHHKKLMDAQRNLFDPQKT
jgi:hypothetical protein